MRKILFVMFALIVGALSVNGQKRDKNGLKMVKRVVLLERGLDDKYHKNTYTFNYDKDGWLCGIIDTLFLSNGDFFIHRRHVKDNVLWRDVYEEGDRYRDNGVFFLNPNDSNKIYKSISMDLETSTSGYVCKPWITVTEYFEDYSVERLYKSKRNFNCKTWDFSKPNLAQDFTFVEENKHSNNSSIVTDEVTHCDTINDLNILPVFILSGHTTFERRKSLFTTPLIKKIEKSNKGNNGEWSYKYDSKGNLVEIRKYHPTKPDMLKIEYVQ